MARPRRAKILRASEFRPVQSHNWEPVELVGDAIPEFLHGLRDSSISHVHASGIACCTDEEVIGGIDVYRYSSEDPVALNKDWYQVREVAGITDFVVDGPLRDHEHWLNEIPARLQGVPVIGRLRNKKRGE